ncbi:MAG: HlyD family efflux transporter periplasmic adaptor subunit [Acidobacteria bacterium]|nr:HlyD family efflux transporter periplasmic adaptor subunit [Acidobacteriota bacterium]
MAGWLKNGRVWLGVLLVGGLLAVAMWPRAIPVEMTQATEGPLVVTLDEDGRTRVRDRFVLTAPVAGELLRVSLRPGDRVERGKTTLAVLRAAAPVPLDVRTRAEAEAAVRAAEAAVSRLTAERARAEAAVVPLADRVRRSLALATAGALASEVLEAQAAELRVAEEAVKAAEFAVAQAQQELNAARARLAVPPPGGSAREWVLVAPVSGTVLVRHHESQSVVPAGEPILEIGDVGRLEIVADLLSADAIKVRPGAAVVIDQWGGQGTLGGRVDRVEPSGFTKLSALGVEEQRVNVIIDFDRSSEQAKLIGDNYRVEVRIVIWQSESVLRVPPAALFRRGAEWAVFAVQDGVARERTVEIGERNADHAQVLDGLVEGDTVVIYPPDTLADGMTVVRR